MSDSAPDLFPYLRPDARIWLSGSFKDGGRAEVRDGRWKLQLDFSPTEFSVLAILIRAAEETAELEPWGRRGFLSSADLKRRLKRQAAGVADPQELTRYVWRIRSKIRTNLETVSDEQVNPLRWAEQFLEYDSAAGYRISAPPEQLKLLVVGHVEV